MKLLISQKALDNFEKTELGRSLRSLIEQARLACELAEAFEFLSKSSSWLTVEEHGDNKYVLRQLINPERSIIMSQGKTPLSAIQNARNKEEKSNA